MKKITLLLLFISFNSFSQIHFLTHKQEKISYKEYDNLKYLASLDEKIIYTDDVVRYYDNGTTLLYSIVETTKDDTTTKIYMYPSGSLEYSTVYNDKKSVLRQGNLKVNGGNYLFTLSSCDSDNCYYWVFVNKDLVYKNNAPTLK